MPYVDRVGIRDNRVQEKFARILIWPVLWNRVTLRIKVLQNGLNILVFLDQRNRTRWPNVLDRVTIVASKQDT